MQWSFSNNEEVVKYFKLNGYAINLATVYRWIKKGVSTGMGRPPAIPMEAEVGLMKLILQLDMQGFQMTRNRIVEIASNYVKDPSARERFSCKGEAGVPGRKWYQGFVKRMTPKFPGLTEVSQRG